MSRLKTKTVILIITAFFCFFVFVNGADAGNNGSKSRLSKVKINSTRSLKKNTPDIYAVENELIVKFKKSSSRNNRNRIISKNSLNRIKDISATETKRYKIPAGKNIEELTEELKKNQDIEYAEPNYVAQALYIPNDEYLSQQWGLEKINVYEAWDSTSGDADAIIAVLDSGIDYGHSEFTNQIANGYDFVNSDDMSEDDNGHGTMVSGIISAKCNNNAGIAGTAPNSKIMPVKILDADGFGSYSDIAEGIIFAADNGAKVINLSLGGYGYSQFLQDAVNYAYNKGCVIVAAAGNDNTSEPLYPAGCANVVAVSSINRNGEKSSFSNYGSYIDLCAPGDSIISGAIGNTYKYGSGTSYSAPFVSGIAALVFSKFKTITNAQVISKLYETAQDKGASGKDEIFGNGLPDAGAAVKSEIFNSVEYETFTVVADKLSITMRKLTEEEFFEMKRKTGVYEEGKNYNKIINGFGTGLKPPTEEQWEKIREELMLAEKIEYLDPRQQAPVSFDNSTTDWFPPIGNQGAKGSCVSWATGYYMKTFQEAKEHGWNLSGASWVGGYSGAPTASYQYQIFSPDFLYHLVNDGGDNGSYYSDNINVMKEAGICSWKNKPYNMNDTVSWPSETAWREAPLYRSATGYTTLSVTSDAGLLNLKNLLSGGNLAIIAVDADKYPNMTAEDLWTADNYTSPDYNHGNTVVGYDDNFGPYTEGGETRYGAFKIANQWGKGSWPGDNNLDGFFWISYAAMKTTSCFGQVWYFTNSEGYNPQILAVYKIDHNKRNDCKIKIGTGNPASPDKVKNIYEMSAYADGGPHPFPNNRIAIDVTELKNYLSSKKMFIQVNDSPTIDTGWILDFEIEFYNNYDTAGKADSVFVSASAPVFTINNNNVTLTLSVVDTQTSYNSKKISSSFHTINIDGTNDFLNAELIDSCITESNWGTNNNLDSLYLTYNADTLYIGVTGKFDDASNNYAVCYIDRDFGENTGLKHFLSLTDETENPDAAISNWINASYMGGGGFGAELAVGWDGYSQTGGIRRFESESKYGNMDWLTNAKISGGGQYFECAIPFSEIYNNISLTGKKLGVFVVLTNSAGTHISNQFIPDSALVRQQISVIEIDRNNNGVPDNNIEEDTVYSILIKSPLNNSDTVSQLISVSGTTLNSKSGDSVALYINGIQQSLVFEISSQSQSWSFDAALLTRGNNFISAYLLSGASAIAFDTISVYYYPVDFLCPVNETAEYNIVVSNIIGTDTIYTINSNNCDSVFITASNVLNTDSWSISINPKDTGAYIVLSSPNQNYINSTDTSNIKNYTYGTNAMLKIEVNDSGFNPVGLNYFSDSPVLTFDFSSKNIYSDYGFLRLYYLNTSDSKWYEATHPDSGAASGQEYKLSVGESLLSLPVKHLSHWWFGSEEDSVTAVKGTDIIIDTVLAGETFAAGSVFVMGDTNAGDTLTGFSVSNAGTLNPADIDYVSLFEDGVVLGQYDSGSDTFVDNLNLSGSSWVNNSIDYKFSNNDTGNHFIITVKTKDSADSGADFRLSIPALSIKSFEEDYGPELSINDFDTVIINSISGAASISGPASIEFKYPTVANTKIETSAAEIVVGGTISNAYPGYTVKIYLNNTECSTIILTLSDSTSFSCPVSLRTNPETNYISVYIDSGAGGPGPDDCDTIIVNCSSVRVTFTVDMSGIKNIDTVYLGSADLIGSEWKSYQMQLTDTSSVYSRTFVIPKNKSVTYKFYYTSEGKTVYEYSYFNSYKYLFVFPNNPSYSSVAVRGNWDDWVGSDNLKLDTDGYWRCSKILSASRYEYKFFVNGADWYFDPFNSATNNGNSYLGIDAFPSSSAMREISVSETDVVEYKNWEDTPLNFAGLSVTPIDFDKILIEWDTEIISVVEDAETIVIKYITVEDTVNLNTAGGVSVDTNVFIHSGLNNDSIYMYYAFIRDGSGHFSRFSELKSAKPLNMSIATIIADIGFNADTVELTGDFNNYSMTKLSDGRWGAAISAASYVEYEYKLRVNGSIMEEDAEYEFLYYDTTHLADSIFLRGVFNSWELQDSYMLRKIDGTDTWGIWLTGITDGMQYKYYINGEWEPDPNRSAANSTNGANRKIYLTTPDTFEIDWSGRANPPAFDVQPVSSDSIIIYFSSQSNSDFYDSFYWKIYRSFERDSGYELKYSASAFDSYFIDSGLEPFTTYYYRISGADSGVSAENMKEGNLSVSDSATTLSEFLINFSVSGIIDRQGSPNDSGVVVRISNGVETQSAITSETGYYSLTVHSADTYVFLFYKTGYKNESFEKYINSDTAIQAINLIAGDFYKDGVFGAKDAALLRKYYGKTNPEIDINDDNLVGTEEKNYLKLNYSK